MDQNAPTEAEQAEPAGISRRKAIIGAGAVGAAAWAAPAILRLDKAAAAGSDPDLADSYILSTPISGVRYLGGFQLSNPTTLVTNKAITGIVAGDDLRGIDFRPVDDVLYGIAVTAAGDIRIYTISNPGTNPVATPVGPPSSLPIKVGGTDRLGVDFNPAVDRIRIVSTGGHNLRYFPAVGATPGALAAVDGTPNFKAGDPNEGDPAFPGGAAYTNNVPGAPGGTVLYVIDVDADILAIQAPPNAGTLSTVGSTVINARALSGFDITTVGGQDAAFAVYLNGGQVRLYSVVLATGAHAQVGQLANTPQAGGPKYPNVEGLAIRT